MSHQGVRKQNTRPQLKSQQTLQQFVTKHRPSAAKMLYDESAGDRDADDDLFTDKGATLHSGEQDKPPNGGAGAGAGTTDNNQEPFDNADEFEPFDEGMVANMTEYESAGIVQDSRMLLQATRSKNTAITRQIFEKCAELKTDLQDEVGKTALHYLCNTNDAEDVRMCAQKSENINIMDKMGWTPLHYAAMRGHKEVVEVLLGMGANCNKPETQSKRTPLHVAVSRGHTHIVNILLMAGADPTMKDKDGKSIGDVAKNESMRDLIGGAVETFETRQSQEVVEMSRDIEKMQIEPNKLTPFLNLGITVKHIVNTDDPEIQRHPPFTLTLQRSNDALDIGKYELQESEDLCSDEFTRTLEGVMDKSDIDIDLSFEIISVPTLKEEMVFKTDTQQEISVDDIREENGKFLGMVRVNIVSFSSFVVVCRPKLEKFEVGDEASTLKSAVDDRVELNIEAGTFEKKVTISMEITETPPKEQLRAVLAECSDLTSTSAFYSLEAENREFSKPIAVKIPLPPNYTGQGTLVIVSMDKPPDEEKPEHWKLIEGQPTVVNGRVEFVVSSFSIKCAVESPRPPSRTSSVMSDSSFGSQASLLSQVSKVFRKSRRKEFKVKFFCMASRQGTSNTFRIITECCIHDKLSSRIAYWESESFKLQGNIQDLNNKSPSVVNAKEKFILKTIGVQLADDDYNAMIEFHPKRENNYHENVVKMPDGDKVRHGTISVYKVGKGQKVDDDEFGEENIDSINVTFYKFHPDMLKELDGKSFLTYNRMIDIQDKLGDRWWKVVLLLDVPFAKLEKTLQNTNLDTQEKINGSLFDWRESSRREKSRGIPILLSALSRSNKSGIVHFLRKQLVIWKNDPQNRSDGFYDWLENAYTYNLLLPTRRTKPMSDPFLAMLADIVKPSTDLVEGLGVDKAQGADILNGHYVYSTPGLKTMKILTMLRTNIAVPKNQLTRIVEVLKQQNLIEPRDYAIMWTKGWVEDCKKTQTNDPDLRGFDQFLTDFKP